MAKMPTPEERPDLYDYADAQPGPSRLSQAYGDKITPQHVKDAIAKRKAKAAKIDPGARSRS